MDRNPETGEPCPACRPQAGDYGALVISLDFELHWGSRDLASAGGPQGDIFLGARHVIPRLLALFEKFEVAVTWATVGFLFARDRAELTDFFPARRPLYKDPRFDPYQQRIGRNETEDPVHFGRSLLERIRATPRQEIGSHTFSHYYCLEEGQDAESFRADLESARRISAATLGVDLRSLVLPRNQFKAAYAPVIRDAGFLCYRGNQRGRIHRAAETSGATAAIRAARLAEAYLPATRDGSPSWRQLESRHAGLYNVRASRFVRPYVPALAAFEPLRARRIASTMRSAARRQRIYHLWWHPHNFAAYPDESLRFLSGILSEFRRLRDRHGFRSMSMAEAADQARTFTRAADPIPAGLGRP